MSTSIYDLDKVIKRGQLQWEQNTPDTDKGWVIPVFVIILTSICLMLITSIYYHWKRRNKEKQEKSNISFDGSHTTSQYLTEENERKGIGKCIKSGTPVNFVVPNIKCPLNDMNMHMVSPRDHLKLKYQQYNMSPQISPKSSTPNFLHAPTLFGSLKSLDEIGKDQHKMRHLENHHNETFLGLNKNYLFDSERRSSWHNLSTSSVFTPERVQPPTRLSCDSSFGSSSDIRNPRSAPRSGSMQRLISVDEFDIDYYRERNGDDGNGLTSPHSRGRLCFLVDLSPKENFLMITVLKGCSFISILDCSLDSRIKLYMESKPQRIYYTSVCRNSADPKWDEIFTFEIDRSRLDDNLILSLQQYDRFSHQVEAALITLPLKEIKHLIANENPKKLWRDMLPKNTVSICRGDIFIIFNYDKNKDQVKCVLEGCRDIIPNMDDPAFLYAMIALYQDDKVRCRRRSKLSPFTEESAVSFEEEVYTLDIDKSDLTDVSLTVTVHCRDWNRKSRILGKANFGSDTYASGEGVRCWNAMIESPGADICDWISLSG